jgi:hypothetical protein
LPELGPREVSGQQALHEATDVSSELPCLGDHVVGITSRVGREFLRVVVVVGAASARLLWRMRLDQLAPEEDADQGAIPTDGDLLAPVGGRDRVERFAELDVVIRVDQAVGPVRCVESFCGQG